MFRHLYVQASPLRFHCLPHRAMLLLRRRNEGSDLTGRLARLAQNSGFVLLLGLVAGMTAPGGAAQTERALLPVLGVIMTVSILDISLRTFLNVRQIAAPATLALILNYVVLSGTIIGLSSLLIDDPDMEIASDWHNCCPGFMMRSVGVCCRLGGTR